VLLYFEKNKDSECLIVSFVCANCGKIGIERRPSGIEGKQVASTGPSSARKENQGIIQNVHYLTDKCVVQSQWC